MGELDELVERVAEEFGGTLDAIAPGLLEGLYLRGSLASGDVAPASDVDVTAVLARRPDANELAALSYAVSRADAAAPGRALDGFCCVAGDLRRPASECPPVPVVRDGAVVGEGTHDVNPASWAELARFGVTLAGRPIELMGVHTDAAELRAFARQSLATTWADAARTLASGWLAAGRRDDAAPRYVLGAARTLSLWRTGELLSKGAAGRWILDDLDPYWHPLAREALRARETPDAPTAYERPTQRGRDIRDFVAWASGQGAPA